METIQSKKIDELIKYIDKHECGKVFIKFALLQIKDFGIVEQYQKLYEYCSN